MDCLYWFDRIQSPDRYLIGDPAFYLSHLGQQGCPVSRGFVVPASVQQGFLDTVQWTEPLLVDLPDSSLHLDLEQPHQLQLISQHIQQEILSSGQLATDCLEELHAAAQQLNVPALMLRPSLAVVDCHPEFSQQLAALMEPQVCWVERDALVTGLQSTWAQMFRAKLLFCLQRLDISLQQVAFAVLVQPLRSVLASGFLQASPTGIEIQASWGLSLAIDRGEVIPDCYSRKFEGDDWSQSLGNKMLAYRLADRSAPNLPPTSSHRDRTSLLAAESCLETVILAADKQQSSVLSTEQLTALQQLADSVTQKLETSGLTLARSFQNSMTLQWCFGESATDLSLLQAMPQSQPPRPGAVPAPSADRSLSQRTTFATTAPLKQTSPLPLAAVEDEHILDLQLVGRGLAASSGYARAQAHVIRNPREDLKHAGSGHILVATTITPEWLPWLRNAAGIIAEQGGMTSHAAIVARELGIPAVVGAMDATRAIETGDWLCVDGDRGSVWRDRAGEERNYSPSQPPLEPSSTSPPSASIAHPSQGIGLEGEPLATKLLVNLSQPDAIDQASQLPVDGIGLLRSEWLLPSLFGHQPPDQWLHHYNAEQFANAVTKSLARFTRAFAPRPVFYRSLDWQASELQSLQEKPLASPASKNILQARGTFRYQLDPTLFDLELAALARLRHAGVGNLHLILPFVRSVEEFAFCRDRIEQAGLLQYSNFQLWIAAEVPSVLFLLAEYVEAGVQGIAIGSNDLTQLMLGVDRDRAELNSVLNAHHPAVQRAIAHLIHRANELGIPCSICGQAPVQFPDLVDNLVRWGIDAISVEASAVEATYLAIASAERRLLLQDAAELKPNRLSS